MSTPPSLRLLGPHWSYGPDGVYAHNGRFDAPAVVVYSSGLASHPARTKVLQAFDRDDTLVIAFALPAHDQTPWPDAALGGRSVDGIVAQRRAIIQELAGSRPVFYVGVSGGAAINDLLAAADRSRTQGLLAVNSVGGRGPCREDLVAAVNAELRQSAELQGFVIRDPATGARAPVPTAGASVDVAADVAAPLHLSIDREVEEAMAELFRSGSERSFSRTALDFLSTAFRGKEASAVGTMRGIVQLGRFYGGGWRDALEISAICARVDTTHAQRHLRGTCPAFVFHSQLDTVSTPEMFATQRHELRPAVALEVNGVAHSWLGNYGSEARLLSSLIADFAVRDAQLLAAGGAVEARRQLVDETRTRMVAAGRSDRIAFIEEWQRLGLPVEGRPSVPSTAPSSAQRRGLGQVVQGWHEAMAERLPFRGRGPDGSGSRASSAHSRARVLALGGNSGLGSPLALGRDAPNLA